MSHSSISDTGPSGISGGPPSYLPRSNSPPPLSTPPISQPPVNRPSDARPTNQSPTKSKPRGNVIPPPPPPRSTLPPVRSPDPLTAAGLANGDVVDANLRGQTLAAGSVSPPAIPPPASTGIASAKGIRWSGEDSVVEPSEPSDDSQSATQEVQHRFKLAWREAPSWLISTVVHLIFLIVLALLSYPTSSGLGTLVLQISESDRDDMVQLAEFDLGEIEEPLVDDPMLTETVEQIETTEIFEQFVPEAIDLAPQPAAIGGDVAVETPPLFSGRRGAMKKALLAAFGGTEDTEEAVTLGLRWLANQQRSDGSWSMAGPYDDGAYTECEVAATAMAIIAMAGAGNTHQEGEFQKQVEKGVKWLVRQHKKGVFLKGRQGHHQAYAQAQAMIAVCELYSMTGDSWLRPYCQQSLDFAERSQSDAGGWRYVPKIDSDTSVTGWYVMGLQSAMHTDLDVPVGCLHNVGYYLDSVSLYDGAAYPYQRGRPQSAAMTAEGLLCRQYLGWDRDNPAMREGLDAILADHNFDQSQHNVYYWYYATQVLHHYGGRHWTTWNNEMREQLPKMQVRRGRERGSWAPQEDMYGASWGRLYTTCLSLYCLEVYYRHMPLYGLVEQD